MYDVHRLQGHVPAYRVTFPDGSHSNVRYSSAGWQADRWRDGVQEFAPRTGYASLTEAIDAVRPEPTMRTTHDPEPDVLKGHSIEEARELSARYTHAAFELTIRLSRHHTGDTSVVRANLEAERNGLELEAVDWLARIAEYVGKIERVRVLPVPRRGAR